MGEIDECYGIWSNLNHPYLEVEDTANAILKFKSGAVANIIVSNSQKPGIYGKVHVHGRSANGWRCHVCGRHVLHPGTPGE